MNKADIVSNKKWHQMKPSFLVYSQHCAPTVQGPVCFFQFSAKRILLLWVSKQNGLWANIMVLTWQEWDYFFHKLLWVPEKKKGYTSVSLPNFKVSPSPTIWNIHDLVHPHHHGLLSKSRVLIQPVANVKSLRGSQCDMIESSRTDTE